MRSGRSPRTLGISNSLSPDTDDGDFRLQSSSVNHLIDDQEYIVIKVILLRSLKKLVYLNFLQVTKCRTHI